MKRYGFILIILILIFIIAVPVMAGKRNAYTMDEYCIEVGWNDESQAYFQTHGVECKFINVFVNGTYRLTMHAEIPQDGDLCYGPPPNFVAEPCEFTFDDWVDDGSPRSYVSEHRCFANFLFFVFEGLDFWTETHWGDRSIATFTPSGNIISTCSKTPDI